MAAINTSLSPINLPGMIQWETFIDALVESYFFRRFAVSPGHASSDFPSTSFICANPLKLNLKTVPRRKKHVVAILTRRIQSSQSPSSHRRACRNIPDRQVSVQGLELL